MSLFQPPVPLPALEGHDLDVVILGGGPAGSAAARLLSLHGHSVVVLSGPRGRHRVLAESLPPSIRKPLSALGLQDIVEEAGFLPCRGNAVAWGGSPLQVREFEEGSDGFQVDRHRFDALLLDGARAAGARVIAEGRCLDVAAVPGQGSLRSVAWAGPGGEKGVFRARWVLDATGRAGVIARRGMRRKPEGPSSTALLTVWEKPGGWVLDEGGFTLVESHREGWVWSVPLPGGRRLVGCVMERRATRGRGADQPLERLCREELDRTVHVRGMLAGARMADPPRACPATPYDAVRYSEPGVLLVGDAGSFLDPLSSFGVKKALASGWLAGVVVHTALRRPSMEAPALALFDERERAALAGHRAGAAAQYAQGAEAHRHPFWTARASMDAGEAPADPDPSTLVEDPRVREAFASLRRAPSSRLRPGAAMRRVPRPTVRGHEVVLQDHLATPALPRGIRFFRAVDLEHLVHLAENHHEVPALFEAYRERTPASPVQLPEFLGALSTLVGLGMLEPCGTP
jgi:flavin-dependent dehydrogenase